MVDSGDKRKRTSDPLELVGWQALADKMNRSVRDAMRFVDENPTFPVIRETNGKPVRAHVHVVDAWLLRWHEAHQVWLVEQNQRHPERRGKPAFRFRPTEPHGVASIVAREE